MSATRPLASLWPMLAQVDAVHGLYYVLLHFWVQIAGTSEVAVRLPSALAVGAATSGLWLLAARFGGARLATVAAAIFLVLPRVTLDGIEARSYAFAIAGVVWIVYGFLRLVVAFPRRGAWWWLWSALIAVSCLMFMYTVLLLPVIGLWLLAGKQRRSLLPRTIGFGAAGLLLASPLVLLAVSQRDQIGFLAHQRPGVKNILVHQWFGGVPLAALAWTLIVLAVVGALVRRGGVGEQLRSLTLLAGLWMVVPPVLLAAISLFSPSYALRYLVICAPGVALLMALGIRVLVRPLPRLRPVVAALLVLAVAAAALPEYLHQRTPKDKANSDLRAVAEVMERGARPGDTVLFDQGFPYAFHPRAALHLYPEAFEGLRDPGLVTPYERTTTLWDVTRAVTETSIDGDSDTVWLATHAEQEGLQTNTEADLASLAGAGFVPASVVTFDHTVVYRLVRAPS